MSLPLAPLDSGLAIGLSQTDGLMALWGRLAQSPWRPVAFVALAIKAFPHRRTEQFSSKARTTTTTGDDEDAIRSVLLPWLLPLLVRCPPGL